ncbi:hypothetical protein LRP49_03760 [Enterovibrio sp. ZSDZ35]|uniref:Uncharacterized protein n=1 Tax=Enterovibrio qingdaonensis TaxID=2899818 RepID=A0ABT5QH49_9GAMM|nr:hypothetical protein [Enterovibrio sp. ZSDZ35]MDD1780310.1 hypothetical protein [Enterovibrio sp. ZSDZ35]
MNNELDIIDSLEELEAFLISIENGGLGLKDVAGVALARNNTDGRPFVAVLDDKHQLILARWLTPEIAETGKDMIQNGPKKH